MSKNKSFAFEDRYTERGNDASDRDWFKTSGVRSDMDYFEPSLTRQEFAEECDINTIMARAEAGGAISHVNRAAPIFLDTTGYPDLQGQMDQFRIASEQFAALPAAVRREFDNSPQKFIDAATDAQYRDRFEAWGLLEPKPAPVAPVKVEVVGQPANDAKPVQGDQKPA